MISKKEIFIENEKGLNITKEVENIIQKNNVKNGLVWLKIQSSTAILTITNSFDYRTYEDIVNCLDRNIPTLVNYKTDVSPFDSSGKIKSSIVGNHLTLWVENGKCFLGSSQAIIAIEFDGPKKVVLEICTIEIDKFIKDTIHIKTKSSDIYDASKEINQILQKNNVESGLLYIFIPHSTAGICLSDDSNEFRIVSRYLLGRMVPEVANFKHRETPSDAAGHIKTALTGVSLFLKVDKGKYINHNDNRVYFLEFDGPRSRKIEVFTIDENLL